MKVRTILLCLAVMLLTEQPAGSGPTLSGLDRRERAHYNKLNTRLNALAGLYVNGPRFSVEFASMRGDDGFYTGIVDCPNDRIAVGGGTDWGFSNYYSNWVVNYSHPSIGGGAWEAGVFAGQGKPSTSPRVYAVCIGH